MLRIVGSVLLGVALWIALAIAMDWCLRKGWPDYAAVEKAMTFTLPMMLARLTESTVALMISSWVAAKIAPASRLAPWAMGIVLLAIFVPIHYGLWNKFPIWYHAYFLASLLAIPLIVAIASRSASAQQAAA